MIVDTTQTKIECEIREIEYKIELAALWSGQLTLINCFLFTEQEPRRVKDLQILQEKMLVILGGLGELGKSAIRRAWASN